MPTERARHPLQVYPRVCGGTNEDTPLLPRRYGLSPRMRGNLCQFHIIPQNVGSIPAYAGEPPSAMVQMPPVPVYPRVCGGTG